jgi:hypothetical protein
MKSAVLRLLISACITFCTGILSSQDREVDFETEVRMFNLESGLAGKLRNSLTSTFLELVESQEKEIQEIALTSRKRADEIKKDETQTSVEKLKQLNELRVEQDKRLSDVLLPHQMKKLEKFNHFVIILNEGLADSLANGLIANELELSTAERDLVKSEAAKALEDYKNDMKDAQKKAVAKLKKSLPKNKQVRFQEYIDFVSKADGTIWNYPTNMLETSNPNGPFLFK